MTDTLAPPVDAPTTPEHVELSCPECGEVIEGPATGRGSAPFKLASHRYRIHKVRADKSKKTAPAAKGRTAPDDGELSGPLGIVRDMQAQIATGTGPPDVASLTKALGRGVSLGTVAAASYAVETDDNLAPLNDRERDAVVDYLSLSDKAAGDVMRPIAKLLAPTKLNKKYGRQVVENVDAVASVAELFTLGLHWRRYFRMRNATGPTTVTGPPAPGEVVRPDGVFSPVQQRTDDGEVRWTSPPPTEGRVLTAEDLKK